MKNKILYLIVSLMILISGCSSNKVSENENNNDSVTVGVVDSEIIERSETLSDIVVELYGIDDATTIILNSTAIIGLKIAYNQELTDETVKVVKSVVIEKDQGIDEVIITDKDKLFSEINSIINELLQGKSYDSLVDEINKIKNKIN